MVLRTSLFVIIAVVSASTLARAQPSGPGHQPGTAEPARVSPGAPADQARVSPGEPAPAPKQLGLSFGFRMSSGALEDELGNQSGLPGYGVFARYRLNARWEIELDLGKMWLDLSGDRERKLRMVQGSVLYHLIARGKFGGHARAGLGRASEVYRTGTTEVDFEDTEVHIGVGAEYALRPDIVISAQGKLLHLERAARGTAPELPGNGHQLGLGVAYRF